MQFLKRLGIGATLVGALFAAGCADSPTSYKDDNTSRYERKQAITQIYDNMRTNPQRAMGDIKRYVAEHGRDDLKDMDRQMLADGYDSEFLKEPENRSPLQTPMGRYGMPVRTGTDSRPSRKPAASGDGLPLQSVTDVYTGEPVRAVLDIDGELYWTPPIVKNDVRLRMAAAKAAAGEPPRVRVDGNGKYYDVDTEDPLINLQLVRTHTSEYGEDLMYAMRNSMGSSAKRFEEMINAYLDNPPSQEIADSAAAGIMSWQEATDRVASQMGVPNRFGVRIVERETRPGVKVIFEGKRRSDGRAIPIGQYAGGETERDENGVPLMAHVYVNPTLNASKAVPAHEFGHAAISMSGGNGPSPYDGGHLPYAGPNNDNLMASIPFVDRPSEFEAFLAVTRYCMSNEGYGPYWTYAETDFTTDPSEGSPDMDGNGTVDFDDFFRFADVFGTTAIEGDLSNDGIVGFDDFFVFADNFGKPAVTTATREQRMEYLNGTQ